MLWSWGFFLLRSKSSLSMEAEVGNCAPFLPKIALVWASTIFFHLCLLPVIHLIHLGHQCWTKILPGVPLNMSFVSLSLSLYGSASIVSTPPCQFPPWQKRLWRDFGASLTMRSRSKYKPLFGYFCCYVYLLVLPTLFIWICRWHGKESCFVPLTRLTGWVMALKSLQTITDCPHRKVKSFLLTNVN